MIWIFIESEESDFKSKQASKRDRPLPDYDAAVADGDDV